MFLVYSAWLLNILFLTKGKGKNKILTRLEVKKFLPAGRLIKFLPARRSRKGKNFYLPKGKNFYLQKGKNFIFARPLGQEYYSYKFDQSAQILREITRNHQYFVKSRYFDNFFKREVKKFLRFHKIFAERLRKTIRNLLPNRRQVTYDFS